MEKLFIKNRKGQKIAVVVDSIGKQGLVFIMHGLGGQKDQVHIKIFAESFIEKGFSVVRFDTTNTFGESDGKYEDATTTNYYEDLEDIISWSATQSWYQQPFWLVGHSLGGMCTALYAQNHPEKVRGLAPISTVVSGELSAARRGPEKLKEWKETGWEVRESQSRPGQMRRTPWSHMVDRLKYNLLTKVHKLTMPVLLIVGEKDDSEPPKHQNIFFNVISEKKELHIIEGAGHNFIKPEHLKEIKQIFSKWIDSIQHAD